MENEYKEEEAKHNLRTVDVIQCRNATRITTKKMLDNDFVYFENSHITNNNYNSFKKEK